MEREERRPSDEPPKVVKGGWSCTPEQKRAIMTATQMLKVGTLDKEPFQLLEQLTSRIWHHPMAAVLGSGSSPEAAQQPSLPEDAQAGVKPSRGSEAESGLDNPSSEPAHKRVVVGSLRAAQEDKWTCKVPSCTGSFHRLKDCRVFHRMEPEDRIKLVEHHELCLGCLTPGHGRAARSCPYKEEQVDACQRTSCRARHHRLLHLDKRRARTSSGSGSPA
jgi:hypothetical protein